MNWPVASCLMVLWLALGATCSSIHLSRIGQDNAHTVKRACVEKTGLPDCGEPGFWDFLSDSEESPDER